MRNWYGVGPKVLDQMADVYDFLLKIQDETVICHAKAGKVYGSDSFEI
jgi:hypothetical protein